MERLSSLAFWRSRYARFFVASCDPSCLDLRCSATFALLGRLPPSRSPKLPFRFDRTDALHPAPRDVMPTLRLRVFRPLSDASPSLVCGFPEGSLDPLSLPRPSLLPLHLRRTLCLPASISACLRPRPTSPSSSLSLPRPDMPTLQVYLSRLLPDGSLSFLPS